MAERPLRTRDIARQLGVHVNTVRLYEDSSYLPPIPRDANGYRRYSAIHLEQARLVQLTLQWPLLGDKALLVDLVTRAAAGDYGMAIELAYRYLARVRAERTSAEAAIAFLERWLAGQLRDAPPEQLTIGAAAAQLAVTPDMLRNWERNGLISVPRDPANRYRRYGAPEFGRLRVIRTLAQAGYSQMAILTMLHRVDADSAVDLRVALEVPVEEASIHVSADRWLSTLGAIEQRALAIIAQLGRLIDTARPVGHGAIPQNPPYGAPTLYADTNRLSAGGGCYGFSRPATLAARLDCPRGARHRAGYRGEPSLCRRYTSGYLASNGRTARLRRSATRRGRVPGLAQSPF
ncbi:MerR family DNA-binding transcriptional regulator [Candidatus Gracilibacteria bacterium]|nr:MerR family DNA-binding transcriptional regulator [Candidatus Gracilibacteria bacterium]